MDAVRHAVDRRTLAGARAQRVEVLLGHTIRHAARVMEPPVRGDRVGHSGRQHQPDRCRISGQAHVRDRVVARSTDARPRSRHRDADRHAAHRVPRTPRPHGDDRCLRRQPALTRRDPQARLRAERDRGPRPPRLAGRDPPLPDDRDSTSSITFAATTSTSAATLRCASCWRSAPELGDQLGQRGGEVAQRQAGRARAGRRCRARCWPAGAPVVAVRARAS